ncbi:MAG: hypothetical protein F6J97_09355 [Leptolyngbya sp. SIO4C1]|nr:hypothetical protein [Leptolyngbya sp. SIO4C1]
MANRFRLRPATQLFLTLVGMTAAVWVLRGIGLLTFLPGIVLWILIVACFATGIVNSLRSAR